MLSRIHRKLSSQKIQSDLCIEIKQSLLDDNELGKLSDI
jgi:hypothetical protein